MRLALSSIALALCSSACSGPADVPNTPDLTGELDRYKHPTATLDPASADSALAEMPNLGRLAAGLRSSGYATNTVDEAGRSSSRRDEDNALDIQGSIHINIRCPGDDPDNPVYDADTNGTLDVTIGVDESRIRRGIAGRATNCVLGAEEAGVPIRIAIDGAFAFDLGRDLSIRERWSGELLMIIYGDIDIEGLPMLRNLSARWNAERFEYLFVLDNENRDWVIAQLSDDGITIRDKNVTWFCPDGGSCAMP
jgi:hypothetical protein